MVQLRPTIMKFKWKVVTVLLKIILGISASTHWVVTENGKIQPQLDSPFHMRRPYDLLSLLDQEYRSAEIERLYNEMVQRKAMIDEEWNGLESATELESRLYTSDPDCLSAGQPLSDMDLYSTIVEDGVGRQGIELEELSPAALPLTSQPLEIAEPDCQLTMDLPFTMRTFPHLQVLSWNLTASAETVSLSRTGRQIAAALALNSSSWFLHNLAGLYWRGKGDARQALQCAKRAVYLAPREYRDIALLNLGSMVQQARCPAEAAILLHAAVDHAPQVAASHFALANVYAILGDYNRSIACYDNALRLQPHWPTGVHNRLAVLCHHKLETSLYQLHRVLQAILSRLHDYHSLQEQWLRHQEQLMFQQAALEVKLQGYQHESHSALLTHRGDRCVPQTQEGATMFSCDSKLMAHNLQVDITMSLQMLLKNVEAQAQKISDHMARRLVSPMVEASPRDWERDKKKLSVPLEDEGDGTLEIFVESQKTEEKLTDHKQVENEASSSLLHFRHPRLCAFNEIKDTLLEFLENLMKSQKINKQMLLQHCKTSKFHSESCLEDVNHWLFSSKGVEETKQLKILPIAQSLRVVEEDSWLQNTSSHVIATLILACIHLSQWDLSEIPFTKELPVCTAGRVAGPLAELTAEGFRPMSPEPRLRSLLLGLTLEDSGSFNNVSAHLTHALKEHSWQVQMTAALYWRWAGDGPKMISCLQAAVHTAPSDMKDIPLHHVAQILLALGHRQDALLLTNLALKVAPHSINAHIALFHTYLTMGDPENAAKYRRAALDLYQRSRSTTVP